MWLCTSMMALHQNTQLLILRSLVHWLQKHVHVLKVFSWTSSWFPPKYLGTSSCWYCMAALVAKYIRHGSWQLCCAIFINLRKPLWEWRERDRASHFELHPSITPTVVMCPAVSLQMIHINNTRVVSSKGFPLKWVPCRMLQWDLSWTAYSSSRLHGSFANLFLLFPLFFLPLIIFITSLFFFIPLFKCWLSYS